MRFLCYKREKLLFRFNHSTGNVQRCSKMKKKTLCAEKNRLKTFAKINIANKSELAACGFYYCKGDIICYFCNARRNNWAITERIFDIHNTISSCCPILNNTFEGNLPLTNNLSIILEVGCMPLTRYLSYESRLVTITSLFTVFGTRENLAVWGFIQLSLEDEEDNVFMCYSCRTMTPQLYPSNFDIQRHHVLSNPNCHHSIILYGGDQWKKFLQETLKNVLKRTANNLDTYIY